MASTSEPGPSAHLPFCNWLSLGVLIILTWSCAAPPTDYDEEPVKFVEIIPRILPYVQEINRVGQEGLSMLQSAVGQSRRRAFREYVNAVRQLEVAQRDALGSLERLAMNPTNMADAASFLKALSESYDSELEHLYSGQDKVPPEGQARSDGRNTHEETRAGSEKYDRTFVFYYTNAPRDCDWHIKISVFDSEGAPLFGGALESIEAGSIAANSSGFVKGRMSPEDLGTFLFDRKEVMSAIVNFVCIEPETNLVVLEAPGEVYTRLKRGWKFSDPDGPPLI